MFDHPVPSAPDPALRARVLAAAGARGDVADELSAYNRNRIDPARFARLPAFPLADEPHLDAWRDYLAGAGPAGVWPVLRERLVQLRFPIEEGISATEAYRAASRRGEPPGQEVAAGGFTLDRPAELELVLHPSIAGHVPILIAAGRADFEALVRAFTARSEPAPVPASMGACLVAGFNNWDRVRRHRERWQAGADGRDDAAWADELRALAGRKELYQDRFILLSRGAYSNVRAGEVLGAGDEDWLARSLAIRREHECTHYFTLRVFGALQHNLLEELVADYVGLVRGSGTYSAEVALRFLGLEAYPAFRPGGRMENYRGSPPLGDQAFAVLGALVKAAAHNLETLSRAHGPAPSLEALAGEVAALTSLTLEELAAPEAGELVAHRRSAMSSRPA